MGYELRRALREALGPEIKGMPRAVALEIADDARDETRESYCSLEDLARWTGAKDTNVVRDALKRLGAAGWEFRVPIGKGKDGRLLYAVPGTRMTFRVPDFEEVATTRPKGESGLPLEPEGRVTTPSEGVLTPSQGVVTPSEGVRTTPFSSSPQPPLSPQSREADPSTPAAPPDEREINQVLDAYTKALGRPPTPAVASKIRDQATQLLATLPAWWLADRARELAERGWTDLAKHCEHSTVPTERVATDTKAGWCGQCIAPNYRLRKDPHRDNELVECGTCNPVALARQRRTQTGDTAA